MALFIDTKNRFRNNRKLTFQNSLTNSNKKISHKKNIFVSNVYIPVITTNTLNAKKSINSRNAKIGNIQFYYDPITNICYLSSLTNKLDVQNVMFMENDNVQIGGNLKVDTDVKASNGLFNGDVMADNVNLLGDLVSTNCYVTNNMTIDGETIMTHAKVSNGLDINGLLVVDEITNNNITVNSSANIRNILTNSIGSLDDLYLSSGLNHTINIPNIKYGIDISGSPIITPTKIKLMKIFIVNNNIMLQSDASCDGIEIIIFNNNFTGAIVVRDTTNIIDTICAKTASKFLYLFITNSWIKT